MIFCISPFNFLSISPNNNDFFKLVSGCGGGLFFFFSSQVFYSHSKISR
nr:MAG TPA: hypothetical protein [Caudoviricetes sp.]